MAQALAELQIPPCTICSHPIALPQDAATKSYACACCYHTSCFVQYLSGFYTFSDKYCPCGALLFQHAPHSVAGDSTEDSPAAAQLAATQATPAFKKDLKELRAKRRAQGVARTAYKAAQKDAKHQFQTAAAPLIQALKAQKKEAVQALRTAPATRGFQAAKRRYEAAKSQFAKKYNLTRHQLYTFVPRVSRFSYRRDQISYLPYLFRVRI